MIMQKDQPLSKNYDLNFITSESVREEESKTVFERLDNIFSENPSAISLDGDLGRLSSMLSHSVNGILSVNFTQEVSSPYDSFEDNGQNIVSRILRMRSRSSIAKVGGKPSDFVDYDIYLIALMGENQTSVRMKNCSIGAIRTANGDINYFKISPNENLGKLIVDRAIKDHDSDRVLSEAGDIDRSAFSVAPLEADEQYMAVSEFEKAISTLGSE